jgi:hypothetical protein
LWFVVNKILARQSILDFLFDPLRDLCGGAFGSFSTCGRLRTKAYEAEVPLSEASLGYFSYILFAIVPLVFLTILAIRTTDSELKQKSDRMQRIKASAIFGSFFMMFMSIGAFALVLFDLQPGRRLGPELARHFWIWASLEFWFESIFVFRASRYAPHPEPPPPSAEPSPVDYWDKREP